MELETAAFARLLAVFESPLFCARTIRRGKQAGLCADFDIDFARNIAVVKVGVCFQCREVGWRCNLVCYCNKLGFCRVLEARRSRLSACNENFLAALKRFRTREATSRRVDFDRNDSARFGKRIAPKVGSQITTESRYQIRALVLIFYVSALEGAKTLQRLAPGMNPNDQRIA